MPEKLARQWCRLRSSNALLVFVILAFLLGSRLAVRADSVVVFNEVMYHPATQEPLLEWVELHNQNAVDVDLSGWRLSDAVDYMFPNGTVIKGRGYLTVAISPATLIGAGAVNVVGPFAGRLSNNGAELKLRDNHDRLMDAMDYGVGGEWPVPPDGSGASLAKRHPNLASADARNWTSSTQAGGTPGGLNFSSAPVLGPSVTVIPLDAQWRYDDRGVDLGGGWQAPDYNDSGWALGAGLFFVEDGPLPGPRTTPLQPGVNTSYFRGSFQLDGDPASKVMSFRAVVDDGAVVYVNGTEVQRLNMPAGPVTFDTMASASVPDAGFTGPFAIASSYLVSGLNVIAVELHQTTSVTNAGLRISNATGYTAVWDGADGSFSTASSPALAPENAALASMGVEVFASSNPTLASRVNDGHYGDASAWSPGAEANPYVVLRFNRTIEVSSIAWGRDNGDATDPACPEGTCTDRSLGNWTFQYTLHPDPASIINSSSNPANGWATIATATFLSAQPGFTPHLRHRFDLARTSGEPILATGIRLRPAAGNAVDEIEINPPTVSTYDAAFGLELASRDILPPPPSLALNEISAASPADFWLEIINTGNNPVNLAGVKLGLGSGSYLFPAGMLASGAIVAVTPPALGFGAADGNKLFLLANGGQAVLDAVEVRSVPRARFPDGTGDWMYPTSPTPGAPNLVALRQDMVINEMMYHAAPLDPEPAVTSSVEVLPLDGAWRYHDLGMDLGTAWRAPDFNDGAWAVGSGPLAFNTGSLPAPPGTTLAAGRSTYYFRTSFHFLGSTANVALDIRPVVDDGAVFYLNGIEVFRQNMPAGPVSYSTSASGPVGDAGYAQTIVIPAEQLAQGLNVLAVEAHQITAATFSSGIVLSGGGLTLAEEGPFGGAPPMNLARQPGTATFVIDSLAGYPIHNFVGLTDGVYGNGNSWIGNTGNPGYAGVRFGGLFTISSIAFGRDNTGTYNDRTLGIYTLQYTRVASPGTATAATGNPDTGWATIGTLNYQNAGTGLFSTPSRRHRFRFDPVDATGFRLLVPGTGLGAGTCIDELEVNPPDTTGDIAFGAELALVTTITPAAAYADSDEEWVEVYNRGTAEVDLTGWRLDAGIDFRFTNGPVVPPGGYAVIARAAAALRAKWPEVASRIVGDFSGRLEGGERFLLRDATGNPVDQTRVFEGGWSDGGGSSLERRDPDADSLNPDTWVDSDESAKAGWETVSYRMVAGQTIGPTRWNEFRLGLLDEGEVLVDDVSVVRDPDGAREQLIQNGGFDTTTGNTHWRFLGHHRGELIFDPDNPGNRVLKVSAGGRAVMNHNHVETTFVGNTPLVNGQLYEVSYRTRWRAGSPQVSTRAYFAKLAKVTLLTIPARLGTPAAPNSRLVPNAGPTFSQLRHEPIIPAAAQSVAISFQASDSDGVTSATLFYRVNPAAAFTSLPMSLGSDGRWTATLPGETAGRIVHFYATASDTLGALAMVPSKGPDSRALYQVADAQGTALATHELRLIMLDADRDFMFAPTNVMSNARLGGTLIYDRTEVFYDVGPRLQGTAASRIRDGDNYVSYDIAFPDGQLFRGVQNNIGIDRSGRGPTVRGQDEMYVFQMFHRAGLPIPYHDLCFFISPRTVHTGTAILQLAGYGRGFVDEQYGQDGSVYNMDLTYEPDSTIDGGVESAKLPVPHQAHIGTDFADLGDKEQYRFPFDIRLENRRDDYEGLMRLCRTMGLPQAQFDDQIAGVLDVDQVLRMTALGILCNIGDTYISSSASLQHNLRLITFPNGDPAQFLPWDMDFVFGASTPTTSSLFPYSGYNLSKLVNHPSNRRAYFYHINDLCQTAFITDYLNPWLAHYGAMVGQAFSGAAPYITSRRNYALSQLPAATPFAITSNNGEGFEVNTNIIALAGTGWIDIRELEVNGLLYPVKWTSVTNWELTLPLATGPNLLAVQGVDREGSRRPNLSDSINVTNSAAAILRPVVINEWMADNAGPGGLADPSDALYQDWFELYNPNPVPVDLSGHYLTDTLAQRTQWIIPNGTVIGPHGFLLVWADDDPEQNPPISPDLHAIFRLNNEGEALGLFAPDGLVPRHTVSFGAQAENVSQGLFPDGQIGSVHSMPHWTPRGPNQIGPPPSPQMLAFVVEAGVMTMTFETIPGRSYHLEYSENLEAPAWIPLGDPRKAPGQTLTVIESAGPGPHRFFRVRLVE